MQQKQSWKWTMVCLTVSAWLLLGSPGAPAQTPPAARQVKGDRLVMGLIEKFRDYIRPWINGSADGSVANFHLRRFGVCSLPMTQNAKRGERRWR